MSALSLIFPLCFSLFIQFALWLNLLHPFNTLFENFNRTIYLGFSISGFFIACISLVFYRVLVFNNVNKVAFIIASILQIFSLFSCALFTFSSITGWMTLI